MKRCIIKESFSIQLDISLREGSHDSRDDGELIITSSHTIIALAVTWSCWFSDEADQRQGTRRCSHGEPQPATSGGAMHRDERLVTQQQQPPITATIEVAIRALKSVATWWRLPRLASHETKQSKPSVAVRPDTLWHWRYCLCLPRKLALGLREELVVVESEKELHEEGTRLLVAHATEDRKQQVRLPLKVLQPRHCKLSVMYV